MSKEGSRNWKKGKQSYR